MLMSCVRVQMINRTRTFLKPLFDDNPNIRVVQFGLFAVAVVVFQLCSLHFRSYDILTFSKGLLCPAFGALVFPKCKGNITCVNTEFLLMQVLPACLLSQFNFLVCCLFSSVLMIFIHSQYSYVDKMRALGPFPRHDSVNLLGTLRTPLFLLLFAVLCCYLLFFAVARSSLYFVFSAHFHVRTRTLGCACRGGWQNSWRGNHKAQPRVLLTRSIHAGAYLSNSVTL